MTGVSEKYNAFLDRFGISGSVIKLIAMLTMLLDHTGLILCQGTDLYLPLRCAGRLAFPLFALLVAEGIAHTRDIKNYALRMFLFAVVSEVPFTYVQTGLIFKLGRCNIFFTYLIPILIVAVREQLRGSKYEKAAIAAAIIIGLGCVKLFGPEYGTTGVVLVLLLYELRDYGLIRYALVGIFLLFSWTDYQMIGAAAVIIMALYNGRRGFVRGIPAQVGAYAFYPLHLLGLYIISLIG